MAQKPPKHPGTWFVTIDGNYVKGDNLCGYCFYHKGLLSRKLVKLHKCKGKYADGSVCRKFLEFERHTNGQSYIPKPVGEEFRKTL